LTTMPPTYPPTSILYKKGVIICHSERSEESTALYRATKYYKDKRTTRLYPIGK